jgi:hypothetical protein
MRTRVLVATIAAAALLALAAAPAASALRVTVRAEGTDRHVIPTTVVNMPATRAVVSDTAGNRYLYNDASSATAANALYWATELRGVPWVFSVSPLGLFIDSIDGLASDPSTYANWWEFTVNGFASNVGAGDLLAKAGDSYVFFQNPSSDMLHGAKLLVVRFAPGRSIKAGRAVRITVVGDDLAKADSAADARRFHATQIETPAHFKPVSGATLHVGNRVYELRGSSILIKGLRVGRHAVWAEKAMDATWVYAPSAITLVNVHR